MGVSSGGFYFLRSTHRVGETPERPFSPSGPSTGLGRLFGGAQPPRSIHRERETLRGSAAPEVYPQGRGDSSGGL